jgi:murein DD-endopeptidase MepM/ murein hydrolase activator NlpD
MPSVKKFAAKTISLLSLTLFLAANAHAASSDVLKIDDAGNAQASAEVNKMLANGDQKFRALFNSWKQLDEVGQGVIAIPSARPVQNFSFTSGFGVRADPFRHSAAMHAGIDLAGPTGTPVYATADGIVSYSGWMHGYGNLVEIAHGKAIETRYGHLSKLLVKPNTRVKRGQLIALMGSTGRSTGSHLHYEVRLDGRAVNPVPYLQATDYLLAMQKRATEGQVALGGPDD